MKDRGILSCRPTQTRCAFGGKCVLRGICGAVQSEESPRPYRMVSAPRNMVFTRDDLGGILVIRSGWVVSLSYAQTGSPFVHVLLNRGMTLGEAALYSEKTLSDNLMAITDAEFCYLPNNLLHRAIETDVSLCREILAAASDNERAFAQSVWVLQGARVINKVKRLFSLYRVWSEQGEGDMVLPISHETLALIINAERASVTRALAKLEEQGLLVLKPRSITVRQQYWRSAQCATEDYWDSARFDG